MSLSFCTLTLSLKKRREKKKLMVVDPEVPVSPLNSADLRGGIHPLTMNLVW
jgi:hypothetical protein